MILYEAIAVGITWPIDPPKRRFHVGPQLAQRLDVTGVLDVEPDQHHEQGRRIYAAVIESERNLTQRCHLAAAHLVQDFSRLGFRQKDRNLATDKLLTAGGHP